MTDDQKKSIKRFRNQGVGYKTIAKMLGLSDNTVKSYCQRNGIGGVKTDLAPDEKTLLCKCCGKKVKQNPGRRPKLFCNDSCRMGYWNNHLDDVNRKAYYSFTCAHCGKQFTAYGNAGRKYCSSRCYFDDRFPDRIDKIRPKNPQYFGTI